MNDRIPEPPVPAEARIRVPGAARPVHPPPSLLPPPGNVRTGVLSVAGGSLAVLVLLLGLGGGISFGTDDGGGIDGSRLTGGLGRGSGGWDEPPPTPSRTVPTPTPTPTRTRTPSATPTITRTPSVSVSPSSSWFGGSPSPSRSGSATATTTATTTTTATASATATATPTGPARPDAVLSDYFAAVNTGAYRTAWQLGGRNLAGDYDTFVAGFNETTSTTVTVLSVDGAAVTATLEARQTDGTVRRFRGVYTVTDGAIAKATVTRTG
ncbi:hypothetical protein [Streptomyces sp. XY431]|uniref:hypothetical protein n=1 Tax=Streptomyces sp. XY431 TaxID=1415562 RepID=UPI000B3015B9|nr:hypothetical protein [Streptomyces sp. XY431]